MACALQRHDVCPNHSGRGKTTEVETGHCVRVAFSQHLPSHLAFLFVLPVLFSLIYSRAPLPSHADVFPSIPEPSFPYSVTSLHYIPTTASDDVAHDPRTLPRLTSPSLPQLKTHCDREDPRHLRTHGLDRHVCKKSEQTCMPPASNHSRSDRQPVDRSFRHASCHASCCH